MAQVSRLPKLISWFNSKGYFQGVFWIVIVSLVSNMNDILQREVGDRLPSMEVTFFRVFFALVTLLPVMLYFRKTAFKTKRPGIHALRSILFFGAIACWIKGLTMVPLVVVSTLALTVQIFVLPMAAVFLKEKVGWQRIAATLAGFSGILVVVVGTSGTQNIVDSLLTLNNGTLFLIAAAMMFALSDILNKKFVSKEPNLPMMFYLSLGTMLFGALPAYNVWITPTMTELSFLFLLGAGGNLILLFLLKAFAATDVSALAPYRYVELFSAAFFGFLIYQEVPSLWTLVGAGIIIPSTFAIAYYETHKTLKEKKRAALAEADLQKAA